MALIRSTQSNTAFAYGVLVSPDNRSIVQSTVPGMIPPMVAIDRTPSEWHGERLLQAEPATGESLLREFHAPVLDAGELVGFVRVGYMEPRFELTYQQLPFFRLDCRYFSWPPLSII